MSLNVRGTGQALSSLLPCFGVNEGRGRTGEVMFARDFGVGASSGSGPTLSSLLVVGRM